MDNIKSTAEQTGSIVIVQLYVGVIIVMIIITIKDLFKKYKNRKK